MEEIAVQRCAHQVALDRAVEAAGLDAAEEKKRCVERTTQLLAEAHHPE